MIPRLQLIYHDVHQGAAPFIGQRFARSAKARFDAAEFLFFPKWPLTLPIKQLGQSLDMAWLKPRSAELMQGVGIIALPGREHMAYRTRHRLAYWNVGGGVSLAGLGQVWQASMHCRWRI